MKILYSYIFFLSMSVGLAQETTLPQEVVTAIQERIDGGIYPGMAIGIIDGDNVRYFSFGVEGYGGNPVDEHSVFEIGSVTKTFTATLLAAMVQKGIVTLDDPVTEYLPADVTVPMRGDKQITLGELSDHTSSLPRMPGNIQPANPLNPYADYTVDKLYAFLASYTLPRDIGSKYEYSNLGAGLLGHVLALKAGMSYEDLVRSAIAIPLGMRETGITLTEEMRKHLAHPYSQGLEVPNWDFDALAGAGAIRSSIADMVKYLRAQMGIDETPLASAMQLTQQARHDKAGTDRVGLGWHIRSSDDGDVCWHNGGTGGYRSFAGFIRSTGLGVIVIVNSDISADDIGFHLLDASVKLQIIKPHVTFELKKFIDQNGTENLEQKYAELKRERPDKYDFGEMEFNALGYYYLGKRNVDAALILFKINTEEHPESANVWDSYGEALLEKGDRDAAIASYKKSIELNPGNMNAVDILAQMGVNLSVPDMHISEDILQSYVGTYELLQGFNIVITRQGTQLHGQATGQPQFGIFPKSETEFYLKVVDAQITFNKDEDGNVKSLTLFQSGQVLEGRKTE